MNIKAVYTSDFLDLEGTPPFIRLFCYDDEALTDAQEVDSNFRLSEYQEEIEESGFYYHDTPVVDTH